jgi:hypothetical protein
MTAEVIVSHADMDRDTAIGMTDILSRDGTESMGITGRGATENTATGTTHHGDTHASTTNHQHPRTGFRGDATFVVNRAHIADVPSFLMAQMLHD